MKINLAYQVNIIQKFTHAALHAGKKIPALYVLRFPFLIKRKIVVLGSVTRNLKFD